MSMVEYKLSLRITFIARYLSMDTQCIFRLNDLLGNEFASGMISLIGSAIY